MIRDKPGSRKMTNLPATATNPKTPTFALSLSDKLTALVLGSDSPIIGPQSANELRQFAAQPEPPCAERGQVETMIGKLAIATAQPKTSQAEADARLELYWLALQDLPLCDLRAGFMELVKTATFLPTPAEVRTAVVSAGSQRRYAKVRARYLVMLHDTKWKPPIPESGMVNPDEVRAFLAARAR